jgi:hypothetical protein
MLQGLPQSQGQLFMLQELQQAGLWELLSKLSEINR